MKNGRDKTFERALRKLTQVIKQAEVKTRAGWLLAVSGGADSLALWRLATVYAQEQGFRLEVAHIDHGLRPSSQVEAQQVKNLGRKQNHSVHVLSLGIDFAGKGMESAARDARHLALDEIRRLRGLDYVVYAHSAEDQAETVLMRLFEGAGLHGLGAMQILKQRRLRPLLEFRRELLHTLAQRMEMQAVDDVSNRDLRFLRPRLRQEILPTLAADFGDLTEALCHLADEAQAADHRNLRALQACRASLLSVDQAIGQRNCVTELDSDLRSRWLVDALEQVHRAPRSGREMIARFAQRVVEPGPFQLHFHRALLQVDRQTINVLALGPGGARTMQNQNKEKKFE